MLLMTSPTVTDRLRAARSGDAPISPEQRQQIRELVQALPGPCRTIYPRDIDGVEGPSGPSLAMLRGALITQLVRLRSVGLHSTHAVRDAIDALESYDGEGDLVEFLRHLSADERARLHADLSSHSHVLAERLGRIPDGWRPRAAVRSAARVGYLTLRDVNDLVVGTITSGLALVDVTTAELDERLERRMRYHALVETLRSGVAPTCVAGLSTATGDSAIYPVTVESLHIAVSELPGVSPS